MKPMARYVIAALIVAAVFAALRVMKPDRPEVAAPRQAPVLDLGHQQATDAAIKDLADRPKQ